MLEAARAAFVSIPLVTYTLHQKAQLGAAYIENHAIQACACAIMAATEAERERCANIADNYARRAFSAIHPSQEAGVAALKIEALIRAGTKGETA